MISHRKKKEYTNTNDMSRMRQAVSVENSKKRVKYRTGVLWVFRKSCLSVYRNYKRVRMHAKNRSYSQSDSLMEEISLFMENNTEAEIIDEEREIR